MQLAGLRVCRVKTPVLIGSHAMNLMLGENIRKPIDIDIIATFDQLPAIKRELTSNSPDSRARVVSIPLSENKTVFKTSTGHIIEVELAWPGTAAAELMDRLNSDPKPQYIHGAVGMCIVPNLDVLYTLKMSHRYLKNSRHFIKTRKDIMTMRERGAKIFDESWLKQRTKETDPAKRPKLNVSKGDFFNGDGVNYIYDHDDIHKSCQHLSAPAYTFYMKDNSPVMCDKNKFFALPQMTRLYGVLEEAQVLALERSQIPFKSDDVDPRVSFDIALQKVCTSITGGWFREFAWEHFDEVDSMYEADYASRFWSDEAAGKVGAFRTT